MKQNRKNNPKASIMDATDITGFARYGCFFVLSLLVLIFAVGMSDRAQGANGACGLALCAYHPPVQSVTRGHWGYREQMTTVKEELNNVDDRAANIEMQAHADSERVR
jgi:hypothetical protein